MGAFLNSDSHKRQRDMNLQQLINDENSLFFTYAIPVITSLAAGASSSQTITFDQDSTFYWTKTTYFADLAAAAINDSTRPIPLLTVSMTDTGSGRLLNNSPTPIDSIAGYKASEPYILPSPRKWAPNSTLRVTITNYSATTTYTNIYLVLHGVKSYR